MDRITGRIRDLPDHELVRMIDRDAEQYTARAVRIAEDEMAARGGLAHLRDEQLAPAKSADQDAEPARAEPTWVARLASLIIGRHPSAAYPALGYVAIGMRLFSWLFSGLAVLAFSTGSLSLLTGSQLGGPMTPLLGLYPLLVFLILFGASELIHVVVDIATDTREGRDLLRTFVSEEDGDSSSPGVP